MKTLVELAHEEVQRSCWLSACVTHFIFIFLFVHLGQTHFVAFYFYDSLLPSQSLSAALVHSSAAQPRRSKALSVAAGRLVVSWGLSRNSAPVSVSMKILWY